MYIPRLPREPLKTFQRNFRLFRGSLRQCSRLYAKLPESRKGILHAVVCLDLKMICGLDFGTSNCSIGIWKNDASLLVPISKNGPYLPSVAYVARKEYADVSINEGLLDRRIEDALREENARRAGARRSGIAYKGLSERDIEARERSLLRQEGVAESEEQYSSQTLADAINSSQKMLFGEEAIQANVSSPGEGFYFKSPKLFLGTDVHKTHLDIFRRIISSMILEVRSRAQTRIGDELRKVVIGHPVRYSLVKGHSGNDQALAVMEGAARDAGFSEVAFLPEPFAAALNYEMSTAQEEVILVVDVGGGTTDCAVIRVGPKRLAEKNRSKDVLSYAGARVGGVDMDFHLAWYAIMPCMGKDTLRKNGLPTPHSVLIDAICVNDFPAQERFRRAGPAIRGLLDEACEPEKLQRLLYVWQQALQFRLVRSAEQAKIALSDKAQTSLPLGYVDSELDIPVSHRRLMDSIDSDLEQMSKVANEAVASASAKIDKIFMTGGTSRSPAVVERIKQSLKLSVPVLSGDDFGAVTMGLTRYAQGIFK